MKGNKLVIAVILALIVCLVLIPTCAFAEGEGEGGDSVTPVVEQEGQQPEQPTTPPVPPTEEEANPSDNDEGKNLPKSGDKEVTEQSASGENEPKDDSSESSGDVKDEAKPEGDKTPGEENVPLQPSESKYTVEFTAGEKQYVLNGDTSVALDEILGELGISGTVTEASSSNDSLFSVAADENGKWTVSANNAFSTTHSLTVVVDGQTYEIVVTDANVCVVKNGSTEAEYGTLQGAIDAANNGDTIVLKDNVTESVNIAAGKTITIDLNGYTLTGTDSTSQTGNEIGTVTATNNSTVTIMNGTINGRLSAYDGATLNLDESLTVNGYLVVWGDGKEGTAGVKTPTANVNCTINCTDYYAIATNGTDKSGATINIGDGAKISSKNDVAIFLPSGHLSVNGTCSIVGTTGIYMKGGSLNISGSTAYIAGIGDKADYLHSNSGCNATGDAIVIEYTSADNSYPPITSVEISGGNFYSKNASSVTQYVYSKTAENPANKEKDNFINGGTFSDSGMLDLVDDDVKLVVKGNGKVGVGDDAFSVIDETQANGGTIEIIKLPEGGATIDGIPEGVKVINKSGEKLVINGVEIEAGVLYVVPAVESKSAFAPLSAKYFVLEGKAQQWTDGDLEFVLNSNAVVKVLIDGVEVEFTVAEDGTVTIASAVIEALDAGTHEIEFVFADGSCTTTFTK